MSENEFYELQGNAYRGSRYGNFAGGGTDTQGNVSSAKTEDATTKVGTAADAAAENYEQSQGEQVTTPATTPSSGLVEAPTLEGAATDAAVGAGLGYAGTKIGQYAGEAIGRGIGFTDAVGEGVSRLANTASSGLIGSVGSATSSATNSALAGMGSKFGPATPSAVSSAAESASGKAASSLGSSSSLGAAAGAGIAAAAATLLTGGNIGEAAKTGTGTAVGAYIGSALGPVGTFFGGVIGGMVGGRVICTSLVKAGLLRKEDQRLDMMFTHQALTNIHVRGYLFWARPWVKKMEASEKLRLRTLALVTWRMNEIKYQLGLREKPDYRGKMVRLIGENICFIIGMFLEDTEESSIYRKGRKHDARFAS